MLLEIKKNDAVTDNCGNIKPIMPYIHATTGEEVVFPRGKWSGYISPQGVKHFIKPYPLAPEDSRFEARGKAVFCWKTTELVQIASELIPEFVPGTGYRVALEEVVIDEGIPRFRADQSIWKALVELNGVYDFR